MAAAMVAAALLGACGDDGESSAPTTITTTTLSQEQLDKQKAERAVLSAADVAHYRAAGADVVLVGEALVTGDPIANLSAFLAV